MPFRIVAADAHVKIAVISDHARRIDAVRLRIALQVQRAARVNAGDLARIDQRPDLVLQVRSPVEIMFPVDGGDAGMREYLSVALLDLPAIFQAVMLVLRRAVLVGAIAGVVVLDEGDGAVFPRLPVGIVADEADAETVPVQRGIVRRLDLILEPELGGKIEDAAGRVEMIGIRGGMPDPAALFALFVPIVFAD
ncbi:MAG: hypothetical protein U1E81_20455 [Xanthobacteraceae bacterium]